MHIVFDLVLKFALDINEGNWLQLLFYFIVLIGIVASVIGMSFFSAVFQVLDWSFLVLHFDGNVFNWIPEVIWPRMDRFWGFWFKTGFFRWLPISMDCNLQELLNCYSFSRHQFFPMFRLRGILVCSLKILLLFCRRILYYRLISFRKAMQLYFLSFCALQPIFLGSSDKTLWLLLKTKWCVFQVLCYLSFDVLLRIP